LRSAGNIRNKQYRNRENEPFHDAAFRLGLMSGQRCAMAPRCRTTGVTRRAEAIELEQPVTVIEGVQVEQPKDCPLPFSDLLFGVCDHPVM
jgi:hypothetical protein